MEMESLLKSIHFVVFQLIIYQEECEVLPSARRDCGWYGISQAQCEANGCCFSTEFIDSPGCFYKKGFNKCEPNLCRNKGTCKEEVNGYSCQCAAGYVGPTCDTEECEVLPSARRGCGWHGISQADCESNGCCFSSEYMHSFWCYQKKGECEVLRVHTEKVVGLEYLGDIRSKRTPIWETKWCFQNRT